MRSQDLVHLARDEDDDNGNGNGKAPTTEDLLDGIAAKVGRIDREFENLRDAHAEDRILLRQISNDLRAYKASIDEVADLFLKIYQEKFSVPNPST